MDPPLRVKFILQSKPSDNWKHYHELSCMYMFLYDLIDPLTVIRTFCWLLLCSIVVWGAEFSLSVTLVYHITTTFSGVQLGFIVNLELTH
jgi:hypothetical protein